ncbi:MAG TPA: metalloregulator ArsR/SmtB family transcription factor [Pirellulales bacterium]|jgi:DNA-binding transcriptional ArsR family regulator
MPDVLSQKFAALADPTRRAMLGRLSRGEANVSELARPFLKGMSLPAVTKHLKVLERAGLITKSRDAQWRPCKLNARAFKDVADWMEEYRIFWEESFDRLEAHLKTVTAKKNAKGTSNGRKK